jgi:lipoprotein NlpD
MTSLRRGLIPVCGLAVLLLGGCMVAKKPAPVVERAPDGARAAAKPKVAPAVAATARTDPRPETYTVKRGDTLYGIALDHGLDYRDLARWNAIVNPNAIEVGQVLRVRDPAAAASAAQAPAASPSGAVATPYQSAPAVSARDVGAPTPKPLTPSGAEAPVESGVVNSPKAVKVPYSDAALARMQGTPPPSAAPAAASPALPERAEATGAPNATADDPDAVVWGWPTKGKVVAHFNENGGPKGLQIAGEMGQPVLASAGGRVVYTGSGLRGYGNLVIIKHNNTYLSAYAHNRSVLVKQGDNVSKGQKIAEMGSSDASRVMLHFEIRRLGKPVDPSKYLPPA